MTGDGRGLLVCRVDVNCVFATFSKQNTAFSLQVADKLTTLHSDGYRNFLTNDTLASQLSFGQFPIREQNELDCLAQIFSGFVQCSALRVRPRKLLDVADVPFSNLFENRRKSVRHRSSPERGSVDLVDIVRLAEGVGFEPTRPCDLHAFQACQINRSCIPPSVQRGLLSKYTRGYSPPQIARSSASINSFSRRSASTSAVSIDWRTLASSTPASIGSARSYARTTSTRVKPSSSSLRV